MQIEFEGRRQILDGPIVIVSYRYLEAHGIHVHRTTLNRWEKLKIFPARVKCGASKIGWIQSEIDEYLRRLALNRRAGK